MEKYRGMQNVKVLNHRDKSTTWKRDYLLAPAAQLSALLKVCSPQARFKHDLSGAQTPKGLKHFAQVSDLLKITGGILILGLGS